ncbi:MAG: helix-turn-helix domain-containing protein [Candidatus Poribacteria bacterium]|nr:helix-turn-helix domain-containing protein [Candidatus Poribacteria bacterium]
MMREYPKWRNFLLGQLARREAAIDYLHITLEEYQVDGNTSFFLKEIQTVIEAQGGIEMVAKQTAMSPETLSKILSSEEAPHFDTFVAILKALGCRLSIEPLNDKETIPDIELAINTESPQLRNEETQLSESD